ncbi:cell surface protein precursor [Lactiplantibacillus plantarum]|nr:cell surface protein precursor [Lactiplantibacillus plantarum]
MNGWNKKLLLGMLTLIMTLLAGMTVIGHAADTANNAVTFDVQPMLNEKQQLSKDAYYWDFKIQPKRAYSLAMRVNNRSNHEIKVKNQFLQSYTNAKGVIDYGAANLNDDTR